MFDETFDINNKQATSFRQYKPPPKQPIVNVRDEAEYTSENFHEILGKFRFEAKGEFNYAVAEEELFNAGFALSLVGWMKVRPTFVLGHVQGDTFALSHFRRYLEEKHLTPEAGKLEWVRLWEMNMGLSPPLDYGTLQCVKDARKYAAKKTHLLRSMESVQSSRLDAHSNNERQNRERFLEEHRVRDY